MSLGQRAWLCKRLSMSSGSILCGAPSGEPPPPPGHRSDNVNTRYNITAIVWGISSPSVCPLKIAANDKREDRAEILAQPKRNWGRHVQLTLCMACGCCAHDDGQKCCVNKHNEWSKPRACAPHSDHGTLQCVALLTVADLESHLTPILLAEWREVTCTSAKAMLQAVLQPLPDCEASCVSPMPPL